MAALDLSSLKSYVSGGAARPLSSGTVLLDVQHSLIEQRFVEIPFDVHGSLDAVKDKIHSLCGTPPSYQQLYLDGPNGTLLSAASATSSSPPPSSSLSLSSFGVRGGSGSGGGGGGSHFLYVVDTDPFALGRNGALHDVSQVKKYVMSDEEYKKRDNTYRAFKERQKQADPNWQSVYQQRAARQQHSSSSSGGKDDDGAAAESLDELRARISVGSRCVIQPADRRGTVKCQHSNTSPHTPATRAICQTVVLLLPHSFTSAVRHSRSRLVVVLTVLRAADWCCAVLCCAVRLCQTLAVCPS